MHSWTTVTSDKDIIVMSAAEVWFLRAEEALRGVDNSVTAKYCDEKGIETSFNQGGVSGYDNYIASEKQPREYKDAFVAEFNAQPRTTVSPKFNPAGTQEQQLEQIITQKWLAIYPEGCEAWAEQRRTGYPQIFQVANNLSGGAISTEEIIPRVPCPQGYKESDPTLYKTSYQQVGGVERQNLCWGSKAG